MGQEILSVEEIECLEQLKINNSNFAHDFYLCTLKIQYLAVIQLSMFRP